MWSRTPCRSVASTAPTGPLLTFRPSGGSAGIAATPCWPEGQDRTLITKCAFRKDGPGSSNGKDIQVEPLLHIEVEGAPGADVAPNERRQGPGVGRHHARHPDRFGQHALQHQRVLLGSRPGCDSSSRRVAGAASTLLWSRIMRLPGSPDRSYLSVRR